MIKPIEVCSFLFLALTQIACKEISTEPVRITEPVVQTDRSQYYFSSDILKDTIWLEAFNGTDSTIFRWYPREYLDLRQPSGSWESIIVAETSPLGPIDPSHSATTFTFVHNTDSNLVPGIYSFYGTVFFTDTCIPSACSQIMVRSNAFSLDWNHP